MKKTKILIAAVVYLTLLLLGPNATFAQENGSKIILSPSYQELGVGKEFQIDVLISTSVATVGADAYIDYDPRVLKVVSIDVGEGFDKVPLKEAKDGTIKITVPNHQVLKKGTLHHILKDCMIPVIC